MYICRSEEFPLQDMLSLGAWRTGHGCSGKILLPPSSPSPSSSPRGSNQVQTKYQPSTNLILSQYRRTTNLFT